MALSKILKTVKSIKQETTFEDGFLKAYEETLIGTQENYPVSPDRYRPSALADGCKRMIYYQRMGLGYNEGSSSATLIDICANGTDRHERIQGTIKAIPNLTWLDVEEVVKEANQVGIKTKFLGWDKNKTEAKCYSGDINANFLCDGVFKYKGKDMLLEIKTIHMYGFQKLNAPLDKHIRQVTCYAMAMGIDHVVFFYEDRNFLNKKIFLYTVTEEDKQEVMRKIAYIEQALLIKQTPPKELDKCLYCDRKTYCKSDKE